MPTDADLRGYLLGELPDHAAESIERSYFARDEMLEAVAEAEREMIEDYLAGRLAPDIRTGFETRYLASPIHRQRLAIARALRGKRAGTTHAGRRATWVPWALAAALAVGVLGVVWRLQGPTGGPAPIVALTIPAVAVRGEGALPTATVADEAATVELRIEHADAGPCAAPEIAVRTVEGDTVWGGPAEGGSSLVTIARVPARKLPDGDYVVLVTCGDPPGTPLQRSAFRIVRR